MISFERDPLDKLAVLQSHDHFRHWNSLDERRLCMLCEKTFSGHDVQVSYEGDAYELHCPTRGCRSHAHQWVYPGNLLSETAYADWWEALADPAENRVHVV